MLNIELNNYKTRRNWPINKQEPPFGAKICSDICTRTLSRDGSPLGRDNVRGQISENIFAVVIFARTTVTK